MKADNCAKAADEIIKEVKSKGACTKSEADKIKRKIGKEYGLARMISDSELYNKSGLDVFRRKPSRSISGVSVVAVMTSPAKCPHGKCVFCPGGVEYMTPQSYTGEEPAALRARRNNYDAYKQVKDRISQYYIIGQIPSKVELIIMGGTFTSRSWNYQKNFINDCFNALNNKRTSLKQSQKLNENAKHRCVGLTVETRPDEISMKTIKRLLELGATRVELGVQSLDNKVLKKSMRGHSVNDIIRATRLLKDAGFKINYHMMTNMPGSTIRKDFESFRKAFNDENFRPDMLKIYPTLLIKGTKLHEMFENKKWKPYTLKQTISLVAKIKRICPDYVRIMRVQRDIPSFKIEQDLKNSNLRQLVNNYMKGKRWVCSCIRCREAGRNKGNLSNANIKIKKYNASRGIEYFIEYSDNNNVLFGFIRSRMKNKVLFIRELHVYGKQAGFGEKGEIQHTGIGRRLLYEAEKLGINEIRIISGVGVRGYYRKMGYNLRNNYMSKFLKHA